MPFCGNEEPHNPHLGCGGIMCDYGCGCVDESLFGAVVLVEE